MAGLVDAEHLLGAGQTGDAAAHQKDRERVAADIYPPVIGEAWIDAEDFPLDAPHSRRIYEGDDPAREKRDEDAGVELREQGKVG